MAVVRTRQHRAAEMSDDAIILESNPYLVLGFLQRVGEVRRGELGIEKGLAGCVTREVTVDASNDVVEVTELKWTHDHKISVVLDV